MAHQLFGALTIAATATWGASSTVSGDGFEPVTSDLGTRDYVGTRPYPVAEVEASSAAAAKASAAAGPPRPRPRAPAGARVGSSRTGAG